MQKTMRIKKALRWANKNKAYILAITIAAALTPQAIQYAECERGYSGAIGGEFLLNPLAILVTYFIKTIPKEMKAIWAEVTQDEKAQ